MWEIIFALGTIILAVLVLNPMHFFMPGMLGMLALAALFVLFCVFAVFVIREKAADEREEAHRALAGRYAFLAGSALLVLGIVFEDLAGNLDPWLIAALVVMIAAKLGARRHVDNEM